MDLFRYHTGTAHCESVALHDIARAVGTPVFVYSTATLRQHCRAFKSAFAAYPTQCCFAVKANSNLSLLAEIFRCGFGADVVSIGELERALAAGVDPGAVVYSGVGKREDEILRAAEAGILSFNVESIAELEQIRQVAARIRQRLPVSLRVNPNINAGANPHVSTGLYASKFGLPEQDVLEIALSILSDTYVRLVGVSCHIGSQICKIGPLSEAAVRVAKLATQLTDSGHPLRFIDMGGGLGIDYHGERPPDLSTYADTFISEIRKTGLGLVVEPGRVVVGNAGILLTRVLYLKQTPERNFIIVDAAMNDLIRPAMYESHHEILPCSEPDGTALDRYDVVGPICETGDCLGKNRLLPPTSAGDLVFIRGAGAYGASMSSNYNSRPRAAEVLVDGSGYRVVRPRECLHSLWAEELPCMRN